MKMLEITLIQVMKAIEVLGSRKKINKPHEESLYNIAISFYTNAG